MGFMERFELETKEIKELLDDGVKNYHKIVANLKDDEATTTPASQAVVKEKE